MNQSDCNSNDHTKHGMYDDDDVSDQFIISNTHYVQCQCGWIYFGMTVADAQKSVDSFNIFYHKSSDETKRMYGNHPASLDQYLHCTNMLFRSGENSRTCRARYDTMKLVELRDLNPALRGVTIEPILWPSENVTK